MAVDKNLQERIEKGARIFEGQIHGEDARGIIDIEFPGLTMASRFVRAYELALRTSVRQTNTDGQGNMVWVRPVVLSINMNDAL